MVLVYLKDKKGVYLAQVLKVWMPNNPYESEEWIRLQLWGKKDSDPEAYTPWWIDGKKRCYQKRAPHLGELWEDVYSSWIRYRLCFPINDGRIHPHDLSQIKNLWGHTLAILLSSVIEFSGNHVSDMAGWKGKP